MGGGFLIGCGGPKATLSNYLLDDYPRSLNSGSMLVRAWRAGFLRSRGESSALRWRSAQLQREFFALWMEPPQGDWRQQDLAAGEPTIGLDDEPPNRPCDIII